MGEMGWTGLGQAAPPLLGVRAPLPCKGAGGVVLTRGAGAGEAIDDVFAASTIDTGVALALIDVDLTVGAAEA